MVTNRHGTGSLAGQEEAVVDEWKAAYRVLADDLTRRGLDVEGIKAALKAQRIETPSWGYGDSGTRF